METTRVSAVANRPVALVSLGTRESSEHLYEGIRLSGPDEDKLISIADALLFHIQVARLRTRPVTIEESEGCVTVRWSRYAPKAFRDRLLHLVGNGELIDTLTVCAA